MRVKISLVGSLAKDAKCSQLWWEVPLLPTKIKVWGSNLLSAAGLANISIDAISMSIKGFAVLLDSSTALLQDSDVLILQLRQQQKKRKREEDVEEQLPPIALASPDADAPSIDVREHQTSAKRPSRSARRKAAKRHRRRSGLDVLPIQSRQHPVELPILLAPPSQKAATAVATRKGTTTTTIVAAARNSSSSSSSSESDSDEVTTSSSSSDSDSEDDSTTTSNNEEIEKGEMDDDDKKKVKASISEDEYSQLPLCHATTMPGIGRVLAYKLLEIGQDFAPRISDIRLGKVIGTSSEGESLILEPYPHPNIHPLHCEYANYDEDDDEEGIELPVGDYDDAGILTTELSSFAEVRYYIDVDDGAAPATALQGVASAEPLGPTNYSRLGPPRPPAAAAVDGAASCTPLVVDTNEEADVWASLLGQLKRRRSEIATPPSLPKQGVHAAPVPTTAAPASSVPRSKEGGIEEITPEQRKKFAKLSKRSALQTAIGPTLRLLRNEKNSPQMSVE